MPVRYLNPDALSSFAPVSLRDKKPYPWHGFERFVHPEGFERLCREFPPLEKFEKHEGLERGYGQRPHNRYYLACEESHYHPQGYQGPGLIQRAELPESWRTFLGELKQPQYRMFLESALEIRRFTLRFAWHVGTTGGEVSPHKDALQKAGIHLFYFSPAETWDPSWGGETLVLGGKRVPDENPDFSDFSEIIPVPFFGNRSLFIRNTPAAWHGVRPLQCPEGRHRRIFTVVVERQGASLRQLLRRGQRALGLRRYPGEKG